MPQPFDQSFKLLSDDDPRATLALFADIPLSANLTVEPLDRELNLTTLRVDNLYRCRDEHSLVPCPHRSRLQLQTIVSG